MSRLVPKLNQVLAIDKAARRDAEVALTEAHHKLAKPGLVNGLSKIYEPNEDGGERLPPETKPVELSVRKAIQDIVRPIARLVNVTAEKDEANTRAVAELKVDDFEISSSIPTTTLLFLEKQLEALGTFIAKLPRLSQDREWEWDNALGVYRTEPVKSYRNAKVPKAMVGYPATDKHPAQVQYYHEDVPIGTYITVNFSGGISAADAEILSARVRKLEDAVKQAREAANLTEVKNSDLGTKLTEYLFAGMV